MRKLISADTVYAAGNVGENTKNLIPSDTVDAAGNVYRTVGENIRFGDKDFSKESVKSIVDVLFPVGSVYAGENSFILSVGTWENIGAEGTPVYVGVLDPTGTTYNAPAIAQTQGSVFTIRVWKRVN